MNQQLIDTIKKDIERSRSHMEIKGSEKLYGELVAKYSSIIPDFKKDLSTNGKATIGGTEFDYRPELTAIAAKLEMYLITNAESNHFFGLVDQISEVEKAFHDASGCMIIYNTKPFMEWKEAVKYELRRLRQDETVKETIRDLDSFNGWTDKKLFGEVSARCRLIRDNYDDYMIDNGKNIMREINRKKVFIVHGRDTNIRDKVELFLRRLGLEPIILANEPNMGKTVIEKFETFSDVSFAIVLYTACDEGRLKNGSVELKDRARQNVVFEHGFFCAKLGRENVVALHEPGVEIPSDLSGIIYISLGNDWEVDIKKEIKAARLDVDWARN